MRRRFKLWKILNFKINIYEYMNKSQIGLKPYSHSILIITA